MEVVEYVVAALLICVNLNGVIFGQFSTVVFEIDRKDRIDESELCRLYDECEKKTEQEDLQCPEYYLRQSPSQPFSESLKCYNEIKDTLIPELKGLQAALHLTAVKCYNETIIKDSIALSEEERAQCGMLAKDLLTRPRTKRETGDELCFQNNTINIDCGSFRQCCVPLSYCKSSVEIVEGIKVKRVAEIKKAINDCLPCLNITET